jgi:mono/diheme cytochrome c family protein
MEVFLEKYMKITARIGGVIVVLSWALINFVGTTNAEEISKDTEWKVPARAARKVNPIPADEKSLILGKAVYSHQCVDCHGSRGKGDGSAAADYDHSAMNLSDPRISNDSDGALFWKITEGKGDMPSFEKLITDDERWHVVNYIRTFTPQGNGGAQKSSKGDNS